MTKWTDFQEFERALEKMGISLGSIVPLPPIEIVEGKDLDNLVIGEVGIYHVDPVTGQVTRLSFHICDKDIQWIKRKGFDAENIIKKSDFDNPKFIKTLHRYHFTYCQTLEEFHKENRELRFYGSSQWNGEFLYSFIHNNQVIKENRKQKLYPCKYCLNNLQKSTKKEYDYKDFDIKEVFNIPPPLKPWINQIANEYIPNIYSDDFQKISTQLKKEKGHICEECGKKYSKHKLHCHHVNHLKYDNRHINLQILCVQCHTKRHPHMQQEKR